MRIAIIESKLNGKGGSQRQALSFAYALQNLGHDVTIYTLAYDKEKCFPEILDKLKVIPLKNLPAKPTKIKVKFIGFLNYFFHSRYENKLCRMLALQIDKDSEIINAHDRLGFRAAAYYKKLVRNVPTVIMMNDILTKSWIAWRRSQFDKSFKQSLKRRIFNWIVDLYEVKKFIKPHDFITVLDNRTKDWVREYFKKEAIIVRSGLDLEKFSYISRPALVKKARIMVAGALFVHRRFEDVIEAMKILKDKGLETALYIVGDNSSNKEYQDYCGRLSDFSVKLGINKRVNFCGRVSDEELMRNYYSNDIYVSSNHLQSWGLACFEAMSCGMPVIVSKTAGASEVLTDGINAILVNPKAPGEIANAIEDLITKPNLYKSLSQKGRKFVEDNISWERSAKNMEKIFESALCADSDRSKTVIIFA